MEREEGNKNQMGDKTIALKLSPDTKVLRLYNGPEVPNAAYPQNSEAPISVAQAKYNKGIKPVGYITTLGAPFEPRPKEGDLDSYQFKHGEMMPIQLAPGFGSLYVDYPGYYQSFKVYMPEPLPDIFRIRSYSRGFEDSVGRVTMTLPEIFSAKEKSLLPQIIDYSAEKQRGLGLNLNDPELLSDPAIPEDNKGHKDCLSIWILGSDALKKIKKP